MEDLTGKVFGRLRVVGFYSLNVNRQSVWCCGCECGSTLNVLRGSLIGGKTVSCGCFKRAMTSRRFTTHGASGTPLYRAWARMKGRCLNKNSKDYRHYGGRGIRVAQRWLSFDNFRADMGRSFVVGCELDRKNNSLGYCRSNCRWATRKEQTNNTRQNRMLTFDGETFTQAQWADLYGIPYGRLKNRIKRGWSMDRALDRRIFTARGIPIHTPNSLSASMT